MELISALMSNPKAVEQIKNIIGNIQSDEKIINTDLENTNVTSPLSESYESKQPDLAFITNLLTENEHSLEMITKMKNAYDVYSDKSDPTINLLSALSPYLSEVRIQNLEKLKTVIRLGKATTAFSKGR